MSRVMLEQSAKITADHLESQRRQYELLDWAPARGWPREGIVVIDERRGKGSATAKTRPGFARLLAAVAGAEAGIVIALEVSRLARNNPDWRHLIYLCQFAGTLIADAQTVFDPALSAYRMVLGIRRQVGELELESRERDRAHDGGALAQGRARGVADDPAAAL